MALPVLVGPNRCALVYNQDKQPLIELSLRVNQLWNSFTPLARSLREKPSLDRPGLPWLSNG